MKTPFIAALVGTALIAGGVLAASNFGNSVSTPVATKNSPTPAGVDANASLKTVTLKVGNMYCASCPVIVRRTLEKVDGVTDVKVSFRSKTATISYDPARCNEAKLAAAATGMGYPSTVVR